MGMRKKPLLLLLLLLITESFLFCLNFHPNYEDNLHMNTGIRNNLKVNLKIFGGYSYIILEDLNNYIDSWNYYYKAWAKHYGGYLEEAYTNLHSGVSFEGEILFSFSNRFSLSFCTGYRYGKNSSKIIYMDIYKSESVHNLTNIIGVIPIKLGVIYSLPITEKLKLNLIGGGGLYFARLSQKYGYDPYGSYWAQWEKNMKSSDLGFHGGLGFEYKINKSLAFVLECLGQYIKIDSLKGKRTYKNSAGQISEQTGKFFYWEEIDKLGIGNFRILPEKPDPTVYRRNIREFVLDLRGFSIRLGVKIILF